MKIGIIGAGNIGGNLTRRFTAAGHEVTVANSRGPGTLADLAAETGAKAVTVAEAARDADLVVVTIPQKRLPDLPADVLAGAADGAVIVDTGNYYPQQRDGKIAEIEAGRTESRWVSDPERRALPIAGDDPAAKAKVAALLDEIGFDTVDAGGLDESWRQQPGTPVYGLSADSAGVRAALAAATEERTAEWRA